MAEYIDRKAVFAAFDEDADGRYCPPDPVNPYYWAKKIVERVPIADVRPVVHAKWEWDPDGMDWGLGAWVCGNCKIKAETWWANDKRNNPLRCSGGRFCGNCGSDMRGDAE